MNLRFISLLLSSSITFTLSAQSNFIGVKAGTAISKTTNSSIQKRKVLIGKSYGLNYEHIFKNDLLISLGFECQTIGFTGSDTWISNYNNLWEEDKYIFSIDRPFELTYYSLPVQIRKTFGDKLYFQPKVGMVFSKNRYSYFYLGDGIRMYKIKDYDIATVVELSAGYKIGKRVNLQLNTSFQHSITDFAPNYQFANSLEYNRTLFLNLGVKYGFGGVDCEASKSVD
jgi:hypothetical protein